MKTKRFLSILTVAAAAAALMPTAAAAASGTVSADVNYALSEITISGSAENGADVAIEVIKPSVTVDLGEGEREYVIDGNSDFDKLPEKVQELMLDHFEVVTAPSGAYSTGYVSAGKPGVYTVLVKSGTADTAKTRFFLETKEESSKYLETMNLYIAAQDKAKVREMITEAKDKYFINAVFYDDSIMGDAVADGVISAGKANGITELIKRVGKYSTVQKLRNTATDAETAGILSGYAQELGITGFEEYPYMVKANDTFKEEVGKRIRKSVFETYADFEKAYKSAMCLTGVHLAENYAEINGILKRAKSAGLITASEYFALGSTKSADEKLIGNNYSTAAELESAIYSAVKSDSGSSGGSGGGSSGGSGGGGKVNVDINTGYIKPSEDSETAFSDVDESHWAYLSILSLKKRGVLNGYADGTFKPDNNITRREFLKAALEAFKITDSGAKSTFADVAENDWCYRWIATAQSHEIINGDEAGNFNGEANVSRQDAAKILYGILKFRSQTLPAEREYSGFNDYADIADYAQESIEALYRGGVINGMGNGDFRPQANATRAETAKMIFSVLQKMGG